MNPLSPSKIMLTDPAIFSNAEKVMFVLAWVSCILFWVNLIELDNLDSSGNPRAGPLALRFQTFGYANRGPCAVCRAGTLPHLQVL